MSDYDMSDENFVGATNDVMFKALFVRNIDLLQGFLNDVIGLGIVKTDDISVLNPEITPEMIEGKFVRLDLDVKAGNNNINVEMQSYKDEFYDRRSLFYWAKMFTEDLQRGEDYSQLKRSISVNILNVNMFDCDTYHSEFGILETNRHSTLTDLFAMHFYELQKIPSIDKESIKNNNGLLWLQLIKANRRELLDMLQQSENALIQKGANAIRALNSDKELRNIIKAREKREHDEASALYSAREKGRAEGREEGRAELKSVLVSQWRNKGYSEEEIQKLLEGV